MTKEEEKNITSLVLRADTLHAIMNVCYENYMQAKKVAEEEEDKIRGGFYDIDYIGSYNYFKNRRHEFYVQAERDYFNAVEDYKRAINDIYNKEINQCKPHGQF